jgi:hypothetical protein
MAAEETEVKKGEAFKLLSNDDIMYMKMAPQYNILISCVQVSLKGQQREMVFFAYCILSRIERKDLKFFSCCTNIYWVRTRFNSFSA